MPCPHWSQLGEHVLPCPVRCIGRVRRACSYERRLRIGGNPSDAVTTALGWAEWWGLCRRRGSHGEVRLRGPTSSLHTRSSSHLRPQSILRFLPGCRVGCRGHPRRSHDRRAGRPPNHHTISERLQPWDSTQRTLSAHTPHKRPLAIPFSALVDTPQGPHH